jgi:hypothetical protein
MAERRADVSADKGQQFGKLKEPGSVSGHGDMIALQTAKLRVARKIAS